METHAVEGPNFGSGLFYATGCSFVTIASYERVQYKLEAPASGSSDWVRGQFTRLRFELVYAHGAKIFDVSSTKDTKEEKNCRDQILVS